MGIKTVYTFGTEYGGDNVAKKLTEILQVKGYKFQYMENPENLLHKKFKRLTKSLKVSKFEG